MAVGGYADGMLDHQAVAQISYDLLDVRREVGSGTFAKVYKAKYGDLGSIALKCLRPQHAVGSPLETFFQEAALLTRLKHSNIIKCYGLCRIPRHAAGKLVGLSWAKETHTWGMVLEYCEAGSLSQLISKQMADARVKQYRFADAVGWALDVSRALCYLHQHTPMLIHRDIKQENVMLTQDANGRLLAKVADFGLHKAVDHTRTKCLRSRSRADSSDTTLHLSPPLSAGQHAMDAWSCEQQQQQQQLFVAIPEDLQRPMAELSQQYRPSMSFPRTRPYSLEGPSEFKERHSCPTQRSPNLWAVVSTSTGGSSAVPPAVRVLDIVRLGTSRMQRCSTLQSHVAAAPLPGAEAAMLVSEGSCGISSRSLQLSQQYNLHGPPQVQYNRSLVSESSGASRSSLMPSRSLASEGSGVSTRSMLLSQNRSAVLCSDGSVSACGGGSSRTVSSQYLRSFTHAGAPDDEPGGPVGVFGQLSRLSPRSDQAGPLPASTSSEHISGAGASSTRHHQRSPLYVSTPAFVPGDHHHEHHSSSRHQLYNPPHHSHQQQQQHHHHHNQPNHHHHDGRSPASPRSPSGLLLAPPAPSSSSSPQPLRLSSSQSLPAQHHHSPLPVAVLSPHSVCTASHELAPWLQQLEAEQSGASSVDHHDNDVIDPTALVARSRAARAAAARSSASQQYGSTSVQYGPGIPEEGADGAGGASPLLFDALPELGRAPSAGFVRTSAAAFDLGPRRPEGGEVFRPLPHRRASVGVLRGDTDDDGPPPSSALLLPSLSYDLRSPSHGWRDGGTVNAAGGTAGADMRVVVQMDGDRRSAPPHLAVAPARSTAPRSRGGGVDFVSSLRKLHDSVTRAVSGGSRAPLKANSEGRIEPYHGGGGGGAALHCASLQYDDGSSGGGGVSRRHLGGEEDEDAVEYDEDGEATDVVHVTVLQDLLSSAGLQFERDWQHVFSLTGETGSLVYMAPEVYSKLPYNEKVDVFSFGVLLYELFTCSLLECTHVSTGAAGDRARPFRSLDDFATAVAGGFRPARGGWLADNDRVWHLIQACWSDDPCQRPNMEAVQVDLEAVHRTVPPSSASKQKRGRGSVTLRHWLALITRR